MVNSTKPKITGITKGFSLTTSSLIINLVINNIQILIIIEIIPENCVAN